MLILRYCSMAYLCPLLFPRIILPSFKRCACYRVLTTICIYHVILTLLYCESDAPTLRALNHP